MIEIALRLKPPWEIVNFTRENPSVSILDWCNFTMEFYQLQTTKPAELSSLSRNFLKLRRRMGFVLRKQVSAGSNSTMFVMKCNHMKRGSVEEIMHRFSSLPLSPFLFRDGWFNITGVCFDEGEIPLMLTRLAKFGELQVTHKTKMNDDMSKENFVIPTGVVVSKLTEKQAQSLLLAVDLGYYRVPRKVRFGHIAKTIKTPRTTYEEHVRKAESKVINAVAPYLSIYFGRKGEII